MRYGIEIDEITAGKLDDPDVAFSLVCELCDAGMEVDSLEAAILLGWIRIGYDDGLGWNFIGMCPDCQREHS